MPFTDCILSSLSLELVELLGRLGSLSDSIRSFCFLNEKSIEF